MKREAQRGWPRATQINSGWTRTGTRIDRLPDPPPTLISIWGAGSNQVKGLVQEDQVRGVYSGPRGPDEQGLDEKADRREGRAPEVRGVSGPGDRVFRVDPALPESGHTSMTKRRWSGL